MCRAVMWRSDVVEHLATPCSIHGAMVAHTVLPMPGTRLLCPALFEPFD